MEQVEQIIVHRFVARVRRIARYRRILAAVGLGLTALSWVASADAWTCRYVLNPVTRTWMRICG